MLKKIKYIALISCLFLPTMLNASQHDVIGNYIKNSKITGQTSFYKYFFHVYDIKLFAQNGDYRPDKPFALSITYGMNLKGKDIAQRSIDEMRAQGFNDTKKLSDWLNFMEKTFPDVKKGTNLIGIFTDKKQTIFLKDGIEIGRSNDADFGQKFFDIWLSEKTSEPKMRKKLLSNAN
jgi:hypothetical protein